MIVPSISCKWRSTICSSVSVRIDALFFLRHECEVHPCSAIDLSGRVERLLKAIVEAASREVGGDTSLATAKPTGSRSFPHCSRENLV